MITNGKAGLTPSKSGSIIVMVSAVSPQRSMINWQAVVITQTQAEFINVTGNAATGAFAGDLSISWSEVADYQFYNVFIATEPGVNSDNFTELADVDKHGYR